MLALASSANFIFLPNYLPFFISLLNYTYSLYVSLSITSSHKTLLGSHICIKRCFFYILYQSGRQSPDPSKQQAWIISTARHELQNKKEIKRFPNIVLVTIWLIFLFYLLVTYILRFLSPHDPVLGNNMILILI